MMDRLLLNEQRIAGMAQGLREVAELPDPVGRMLAETERPSGLKLKKVACPIGVVVMIYSRAPMSQRTRLGCLNPAMPPSYAEARKR